MRRLAGWLDGLARLRLHDGGGDRNAVLRLEPELDRRRGDDPRRGDRSISANDLALRADDLPTGQPGIFIAGPSPVAIPFFNGTLCIDPMGLQRFADARTPVFGKVCTYVDLANAAPGGLNVTAGSSFHYQYWFRDPAAGGGNANFSDGIELVYGP